jgi:uncharacterized secreted protein with C-terminal beta-propeller domain
MAEDTTSSESNSTPEYTETNNQVQGVDEADIVKTDGYYIYVLKRNCSSSYYDSSCYSDNNKDSLIIFSSYPVVNTQELSRISIDGASHEMFIYNDYAIIFSSISSSELPQEVIKNNYIYSWLKITIIDIKDRKNPKILREIINDGSYVTSRLVNDTMHIITKSESRVSSYIYESSSSKLEEKLSKLKINNFVSVSYDYVKENNKKVFKGEIYDCSKTYYEEYSESGSISSIISLDLKNINGEVNSTSVIADNVVVYASKENIYIVSNNQGYFSWSNTDDREISPVHKFDIKTESNRALYIASGEIEGYLLNQFSMDESNGYFRVVTTTGYVGSTGSNAAKNHLFVYDENLNLISGIMELAPNERVYSARFIGDRGFFVTYEKVDPLFTVNLANPYEPTIEGALEISGYSDYIYPLDENHLLTIGKEAEDAGSFSWYQGVKLDLYDVTDLANPILLHRVEIGDRYTTSEALYDHKAFTYFESRKALSIPITIYEDDCETWSCDNMKTFSGFIVFSIDIEDGINELGRVDHYDFDSSSNNYYNSNDRRSIFIDDYLFTISNLGLKANTLDDLNNKVVSIKF